MINCFPLYCAVSLLNSQNRYCLNNTLFRMAAKLGILHLVCINDFKKAPEGAFSKSEPFNFLHGHICQKIAQCRLHLNKRLTAPL